MTRTIRGLRRALTGSADLALLLAVAALVTRLVAGHDAIDRGLLGDAFVPWHRLPLLAAALLVAKDVLRDRAAADPVRRAVAAARRFATAPERRHGVAAVLLTSALGVALASSVALRNVGWNPLDEGLHVTGGWLLANGERLYEDYVLVYPPGSFAFFGALAAAFGVDLGAFRAAAVVLQMVLAALAFGLARRTSGSNLLAALAAIGALAFGLPQGTFTVTAGWLAIAASAASLLVLDARDRAGRGSRRLLVLAGALSGLAILCRQDLGGGGLAGGCVAIGVARALGKGEAGDAGKRRLALAAADAALFLAAAAAVAGAGLASLVAAGVPVARIAECLVSLPFRYARAADYVLPFPSPLAWPIFLFPPLVSAAGLALVVRRRRSPGRGLALVAALATAGLLAYPQVLSRADLWHLSYAMLPPLAIFPRLALEGARLARRTRFVSPWTIAFLVPATFAAYNYEKHVMVPMRLAAWPGHLVPIEGGNAAVAALRVGREDSASVGFVLREIEARSAPGDAIVAVPRDPLLYAVTGRRHATRFLLFTPEFGTSDAEQESAIREIDAADPPLAVIDRTPIDGRTFDEYCPRLAAYIRARFDLVSQHDPFDVLVRRR